MSVLDIPNESVPPIPSLPLSPLLIRAIFLLLGVGILIPWNAFVSAKPYFQARLCQEGAVIVDFELWFGLVWNMSSVVSLGLIIASVAIKDSYCKKSAGEETSRIFNTYHDAGTDTRSIGSQNSGSGSGTTSHHSNHSQQEGHSFWLVMLPLALYLMIFAITDLLVLVPNIEPTTFLMLTLGGLAICGTCGAIATAGIISTAGLFESHLGITPFFSGQALGGVAVSTASFIAATFEDPTDFWDQTCTTPNNQTMTIATMTTTMATTMVVNESNVGVDVHYRLLPPALDSWGASGTCSPYHQIDWAVFGYFFAGCLVLAACLMGYTVINRYQQQEHRDDYETVQDTPITSSGDTAIPVPILDEQSPRVGLEMKDQRGENEVHINIIEAARTNATTHHSYHGDEGIPIGLESTEAIVPAAPNVSESESSVSLLVVAQDNEDENGVEDAFHDEISVEPEEYTEEETEIAVFSAIQGPLTCIVLVFSVTLCLFPSWVSQLRSAHECQTTHFRLFNDLYVPFSFVLFNVGDLTGRILSEWVPVKHIRHMSSKLVCGAVGRLLLFPLLFLFCVTEEVTEDDESRPWVIRSDIYSWVVQFSFAVTNGVLISCSFMHAPHLVAHNTGMQERASEMMTFAVSLGLLTGSLLSFPFATLASKL